MPISNAQLAQQVSDLLSYWRTRDTEYAEWVSGSAAGGPYSNGTFPLTDYLGVVQYVKSPAALQASVDGPVASAQAYATAASGSATAATSAQTAAEAARDLALSYQTGAQAARDLALSYKNYAAASEANAQTYAASAAADAASINGDVAAADASATAAAASASAAATSASDAAASAAAAATFDPANYVPKTGGTFTGAISIATTLTMGGESFLQNNWITTGFGGVLDASAVGTNTTQYASFRLLHLSSAGSGSTNVPDNVNNANALLNINKHPGGYVTQLWLSDSNNIWHRNQSATAWGSWHKLFNTANAAQIFNDIEGNTHGYYTDANSPARFGPAFVQGSTNGPGTGAAQFYTQSYGIGDNYTAAQYRLQVAYPRDALGGLPHPAYRTLENGVWGSWHKIPTLGAANVWTTSQSIISNGSQIVMYDSAGVGDANDRGFLENNEGYINIWSHDNSANAWFRALTMAIGTGQVTVGYNGTYEQVKIETAYGYGLFGPANASWFHMSTDRANFYMAQSLHVNGQYWVYGTQVVMDQYGLYLDYANSIRLAKTDGSYGTATLYGSLGGYAGLRFYHAYGAPYFMLGTGGKNHGVYSEAYGWYWYNNAGYFWTDASLYIVPRCGWATGGSTGSAHMSRGTAAPSGGSDGDIYFQYA